jgi:hypothetical protein
MIDLRKLRRPNTTTSPEIWSITANTKRVAKTGGTILDLVPTQFDYQAGSIAVNDEHVYWTDTTSLADGRLRRVPKGGGPVENLASGLFGPGSVNLSATHVYWGDSGGVWRLRVGMYKIYLPMIVQGH